jgi:two-component system, cell cycle response regulator
MNQQQVSISSAQPKLLLVDDDPAMIRIIGEMLAEFPDQRFATTGETALSLARESTPDLILLDANLPNMTGFDVCEILKRDAKLARVPVIFVTSHDAPALEVDAFRMGAADYVIKPLVAARLQARVRAQLRPRERVTAMLERLRAADAAADTPPPAPAGTRMLAIVCPETADAHRDALESLGKLDVVPDAASALERATTHAPGAIVLDASCCDALDATLSTLLAAHPHVPVIVLAEATDIEAERRTLDAGAADVIAKPARPAVLQARVRAALTAAQSAEGEIRALFDSSKRASVHPFPGNAR